MFGRIRASPSPVEWLELERLPSKLFKDDSLSIYEATLVKLKQGSQLNLTPTSPDSMDSESNSGTSVESQKVSGLPACSSENSCMGVNSSSSQEQKKGREISIHYLFSKYASSHREQGSISSCNRGSLVNILACSSSSDSESTGCSSLQL
ncbi:uncharacterized protein LOC104908723 [Beta vulgaris subsp. vulgaris]|uniref:uncharacterized protein LOC104908723 n=1 Tax=Beta vulgaris subsp. vulgaris TaxID=3555 RepID=UPI002037104F|nr:uncharacterized protein LOC104908723 [Beta vulgaris subsp. vulgaris]